MSKNKILLSVGTLVVAVAIVAGGTIAFYNDTETSAGNIFTAGSIDLKVDHLKQTYNGVDCETCNVTIVSDTTNIVTAKNGVPIATTPAVAVTQIPGAWTASIPGATWIWATDPVLPEDATADVNDNSFAVADTLSPALIPPWLISGANTIKFVVKNKGVPGGTPENNPAGLLYKLTIDGNCSSEYFQQNFQSQCKLWQEKDLGTGDRFFKFDDIKPADWGTNVISLHVSDNDAYACLIANNKDDQENSLLETETEAGDAAGQGNPTGKGELSSFINVFTWSDTDGDGQYDTGESSLGSVGPLSSLASIMREGQRIPMS